MAALWGLMPMVLTLLAKLAHDLICLRRQRYRDATIERILGSARFGTSVVCREADGSSIQITVQKQTASPDQQTDSVAVERWEGGVRG